MTGESDTSVQGPRALRLRARGSTGYLPRTDCVRRVKRELVVLTVLAIVVWLVLVASVFQFLPTKLIPFWSIPGILLHVAATFGLMAYSLRRNLRRLEACNWRRCCWCEYDTTPIGESGTCPECGREFSVALLRADYQGLLDQFAWFLPERWRAASGSESVGQVGASAEHAPLRGPSRDTKDYVDRSIRTSIGIGIIGSIVGFFGSGVIARLLDLKVGPSTFAVLGVLGCTMLVGVVFQMPYLLYRRNRLARRDWNICPWCERDTRDIGTHGICPSCGGEFSAADLKADFDAACRHSAWMFWLRPGSTERAHDNGPSR